MMVLAVNGRTEGKGSFWRQAPRTVTLTAQWNVWALGQELNYECS